MRRRGGSLAGAALAGRPVSGFERLWLVARRVAPPFTISLVLEGDRLPAPASGQTWDELLAAVAERLPGCRVRWRGVLGASRWTPDGSPPRVRLVDAPDWSGRDPEGAPSLTAPLDPRRGPVAEVLLLQGPTPRVVVRALHAALDGRAVLQLAEAVFAALRQELPTRSPCGPLHDEALARHLGVPPEGGLRPPCVLPLPAGVAAAPPGPFSAVRAMTWRRVSVAGADPRSLVARLVVALAQHAAPRGGDVLRVDVPVDLRRHLQGGEHGGNLTGLLRLQAHELLRAADPLQATREALRRGLEGRDELAPVRAAGFARWLPLGLMAWIGRRAARDSHHSNGWGASACVSHLGALDLERLSGGGFSARSAFLLPPGSPGLPLFLAVLSTPSAVELCGCMPARLAAGGRLDELLAALAGALQP